MLLDDDDLWADLIFWKSMKGHLKTAQAESEKSKAVMNDYLSFIVINS